MQAFCCLIPFQIVSAASILINGIDNVGFSASFVISFFFLPYGLLLAFSNSIETLDIDLVYRLIRRGVWYVTIYGIFLFVYRISTGKLIEIPFLTVNWHDLGSVEYKCNGRGMLFKLISTYNNGNIFGIALLIFLPIYCFLEKSPWKKIVVKAALFLTLSRTVWAGLIAFEFLYDLVVMRKIKFVLPKLIFSILGICMCAFLFGYSLDFIFDKSLGSRVSQFDVLQRMSILPDKPFEGFAEITYLAMIYQLGFLGLLTFLIAVIGPLVLIKIRVPYFESERAAFLLGPIIYLIVSFSDGAILLIPIMAFYWIVISLGLRKNLKASV